MLIELKGLSKSYRNFQALEDLTASIRPGAIGLLGPNGAGKSTLIKTLLGLLKLSSGEAQVLGLDVRTQARKIREIVGYMPEDDCAIAGMKGVESVAFAGELAGIPARTSLRRAHEILDFVGMEEERYREVQTFSTGMRQKVKLAQSLIHSPKLVFLDEPTSGLDPNGRLKMLRLIKSLALKKGVSVVVSTHILTDIEACCDQALIIGRGRLLVHDDIATLQKSANPSLRLTIDGEEEAFLRDLEASGLSGELEGQEIVLAGDEQDLSRQVMRLASERGVAIRRLSPSRNSLEETFLKAVRETGTVAAGGGVASGGSPAQRAGSR